ncbi:MAG: hypothetical protein ACOYVK_16050 [Bacillota bacterium]
MLAAWYGNLQKLPRPIALPAMARIKPILDPQFSLALLIEKVLPSKLDNDVM